MLKPSYIKLYVVMLLLKIFMQDIPQIVYIRKTLHKHTCNNINYELLHLKVCQTIRDNGGWTNWEMLIIEKNVCDN